MVIFEAVVIISGSERKDFKYIYVFELTKKGVVHLHGFFSGFFDLYKNEYNHLSSKYFDKLGFQCFRNCNEVNEFYLIKYVSKDFLPFLKQRYFRSRNLKLPVIDKFYDHGELLNLDWTFHSNFCSMTTISN